MTHFEKLIQNSKEGRVYHQVWRQVWIRVRGQVWQRVRGQVWLQVGDQVREDLV